MADEFDLFGMSWNISEKENYDVISWDQQNVLFRHDGISRRFVIAGKRDKFFANDRMMTISFND